jgi:acetyltransferase-like isoleucine patch superfamily enzyme
MNAVVTSMETLERPGKPARIVTPAPAPPSPEGAPRTPREAIEPRGLPRCIADNVCFGRGVRVFAFTNLYGCRIGDDTSIGALVEIQKGATIGARCKVSSHTFICEGVTIEDDVFIGHSVTFINDRYPRATNPEGQPQDERDWKCEPTVVRRGASVGSGSTLLCGVTIGEGAMVGAGSVVTRDIPARTVAAGNPARVMSQL